MVILQFLVTVVAGQTIIPGGTVSGTWQTSGSPYLVQGTIMIPNDSTLLIEPGTTVNFQGHYKILVMGRILALGTVESPITFTASNPTTGWYGIRFDETPSTNDSSVIDHCIIQFGRATEPEFVGGAIKAGSFVSKLRISNCLLKHNWAQTAGGAIYCSPYSSPLILNNVFEYNAVAGVPGISGGGGGVAMTGSFAMVSGNTFFSNHSTNQTDGGGAICIKEGHSYVINNLILYNVATTDGLSWGQGGGGGIYVDGNAHITENTITNNVSNGLYSQGGGGIFIGPEDHSTLENNTITNNSADGNTGCGGAVYFDYYSYPDLTCNTIANNYANQSGGGLYCNSSANPVFRNCIIYGNKANADSNQVFLYDEDSDPEFTYCDIQGGKDDFELNGNFYSGMYMNNITVNPGFESPSEGCGAGYDGFYSYWTEAGDSPCINAGDPDGPYPETDRAGNPRVVEDRIDIGAYEFQWYVGIHDLKDKNLISIIPNPVRQNAVIRISGCPGESILMVRNELGDLVRMIRIQGSGYTRFSKGDLPAGMYHCSLFSGDRQLAIGKLVIVN